MKDIWIFLLPAAALLLSAAAVWMFRFEPQAEQPHEGERGFLWRSSTKKVYWIFMAVCNVGLGISLALHSVAPIPALKALCVTTLLWPCAWTDLRTMRIPNKILLIGVGYRAILLIAELFTAQPGLQGVLVSELIAAVALFVAAFLCRIMVHNSVGGGDIKMMAVMGLFLGLNGIWNALMLSFIIMFVVALSLLLLKKKKKNDALPFAPAVLAGTVITVFFAAI